MEKGWEEKKKIVEEEEEEKKKSKKARQKPNVCTLILYSHKSQSPPTPSGPGWSQQSMWWSWVAEEQAFTWIYRP